MWVTTVSRLCSSLRTKSLQHRPSVRFRAILLAPFTTRHALCLLSSEGSAMRFRHPVPLLCPMTDSRRSPHAPRGEKRFGETLGRRLGSNMVSARTHCPQCHRTGVVRLDEVFYAPNVDFFRCDSCRCMWHVEKGKDGPPSQTLLGHQTLQMAPKQPPDGPSRKPKQ